MTVKRLIEILENCPVSDDAEVEVETAIYHEAVTEGMIKSVEVHDTDDKITLVII